MQVSEYKFKRAKVMPRKHKIKNLGVRQTHRDRIAGKSKKKPVVKQMRAEKADPALESDGGVALFARLVESIKAK